MSRHEKTRSASVAGLNGFGHFDVIVPYLPGRSGDAGRRPIVIRHHVRQHLADEAERRVPGRPRNGFVKGERIRRAHRRVVLLFRDKGRDRNAGRGG